MKTNTSIIVFVTIFAAAVAATDAPAQISVASSTLQEREVAPGESYTGTIRVRNSSEQSRDVRLYQTDYTYSPDGTSGYPEPGSTARSNAGWITFGSDRITVPARDAVDVAYTVAVPADAGTRGSHWSLVMVEGLAADDPTVAGGDPNARVQMGVRTVVRHAVQIATHVRGDAVSRIEFAGARVEREDDGGAVLRFDAINAGERAHRIQVSAEVYDAEGNPVGEFSRGTGLVYPGMGVRREFELGSLPPGVYTVLLLADPGDDDIFGAQYQLSFR